MPTDPGEEELERVDGLGGELGGKVALPVLAARCERFPCGAELDGGCLGLVRELLDFLLVELERLELGQREEAALLCATECPCLPANGRLAEPERPHRRSRAG